MSAQMFVIRGEADRNQLIYRLRALSLVKPWKVTLTEADKRSLDANSAMWAMLTDLSRQVNWYGQKLTAEEWKWVCTAALRRYKVVHGIDGGFVAVGMSTSAMSRKDFSELLDLIKAFGEQQGVRWSASGQEAA